MNLIRLRTLVMVGRSGSISRAAYELHLSQSAVSKHIQGLEEYYGKTLIDRSGREAELTEEGRLLSRYAVEVLRLIEEAEDALGQMGFVVKGALRIGASSIPGQYILPYILGEFGRRYPEVELGMEMGDTRQIVRLVLENHVDLAMIGNPVQERRLECYPFAEDELVVILPRDHPLAQLEVIRAEDLGREKIVWREVGSGTLRTIESYLNQAGVKLEKKKRDLELGSTGAVVAAVEAGLGLSIVSVWAAARHQAAQTLIVRRLPNLSMKRQLYLIRSTQNMRRPAQAFLDYVLGEEGQKFIDHVYTGLLTYNKYHGSVPFL